MLKLRLGLLSTMALAYVASVSAFQTTVPCGGLRSRAAVTALKCSAELPSTGVSHGRRAALHKLAIAASGLPAILSIPARAGAAKKDDDDDDGQPFLIQVK